VSSRFQQVLVLAIVLLGHWPATASDLATYRGFVLGAPTIEVLQHAGASVRELKTVHERPALVQELSWRPPYVVGRDAADRDSVASVSFSFIDNHLFRMTVEYDRDRTEGLTANDLVAALTAKYGPRSTGRRPVAATSGSDSIDAPAVVAWWQEGETTITLIRFPYSSRFALTIASVPLEALARKARAAAAILDAREGPAREAARVKAQVDAERAAAAKTRTTNQATFEP
jgi:hypothetical protein